MKQDRRGSNGFAYRRSLLLAVALLSTQCGAATSDVTTDEETIQQLISAWDTNDYRQKQDARKKLIALGEEAVPILTGLIEDNHRHAGYAMQTLAEMGGPAQGSLPVMLKLAQNKNAEDPDGWTWNMPIRGILLSNARKMSWAANEWIPVLSAIGSDKTDPERIRSSAVYALGGMGTGALPALRTFLKDDLAKLRSSAASAIAKIETEAGKSKVEAWQQIIDTNPFDSNTPSYLASMKGIYNTGKPHPPTEKIKKLYRDTLAKKPDAELAWTLANIIRNQLSGTDLMWASPSDGYRSQSAREDPAESYTTLAEVLEIVVTNSEVGSERHTEAGLSMARLRLLQGDWKGMNAWLSKAGEEPIDETLRPVLSAPPINWKELNKTWRPADEPIRSGECGVEFRFLRRGQRLKGIRGVHVLVKQRSEAPAGNVFRTGFRADTLFLATQPMGSPPFGAFGYRGEDRKLTRYGVSNDSGVVRFEKLPKKPIVVEILVPTANFSEPGQKWELLMATRDGLKPADRSNPKSVDANKPPAVIELVEGETVRYPQIYVRSPLTTNVGDWTKIDKDNFVLTWQGEEGVEIDHHEVRLSISAPTEEILNVSRSPALKTQTVKVSEGKSWAIGARGVGGLRLVPGNIYLIEVASMRNGKTISKSPRCRIWVPWKHRESDPPETRIGQRPAFYDNIWLRTNANGKPLEERLPALINGSPKMFETEYHRLGMAWLDLHKNKPGAKEQLRKLVDELPKGNIIRSTAQSLLKLSANNQTIPKRFKFVGPD